MATPKEIAERSGKPLEKVIEILNSLADRGLMFRLGRSKKRGKFSIWPVVIGIFEFFFSNAKIWPEEKKKKIAKLFDQYFRRTYIHSIGASTYPFPRVIPSKTSEKIININEEINGVSQRILAFEEIEDILGKNSSFGVMPCSCRTKAEILGKGCGKAKDVCMTLGIGAEFFIENGMARRLSKEEALELLKKCERQGLVHMSLNSQRPDFICNCCNDCCGILTSLTKYHRPGIFATSNFKPFIDELVECIECNRCIDICPTHAISSWFENDHMTIEIAENLCIGCGLCASNCTTKRLKLKKIKNEIPEETLPDAYKRYARERTRYIL